MLPLFERLGIRVLSCISGDARFEELRWAHRARLNVIICSKSLTNLARKMKKRWGIPYLEESFYGMTDTARALRDIARELDLAKGGGSTVMRDRVGVPSTWTVQAPHCAMPQPNLVPVSAASSRIAQSSGISASTSSDRLAPLSLNSII